MYAASLAEIKENAFNVNIPRYGDTFEPKPEVDIQAVQKEIEAIEAELTEVRKELDSYLKALGL